jgi:hypothetical protein
MHWLLYTQQCHVQDAKSPTPGQHPLASNINTYTASQMPSVYLMMFSSTRPGRCLAQGPFCQVCCTPPVPHAGSTPTDGRIPYSQATQRPISSTLIHRPRTSSLTQHVLFTGILAARHVRGTCTPHSSQYTGWYSLPAHHCGDSSCHTPLGWPRRTALAQAKRSCHRPAVASVACTVPVASLQVQHTGVEIMHQHHGGYSTTTPLAAVLAPGCLLMQPMRQPHHCHLAAAGLP